MEEKFIELYRLLIELEENKKVPEKYKRELARCINFVEGIIKNPKSKDKKKGVLKKVILFVLMLFNST